MKKKSTKPGKTGITDKVFRNQIAMAEIIERRAASVVEAILYRDKDSIVFQEIGTLDDIREVDVTSMRVDREHKYKPGKTVPEVVEIPRFHAVVKTADGGREGVWIDAYLLEYEGDALSKAVAEYLDRITEPVKKARHDSKIRHLKDLMKKYPEEAKHILNPPVDCGCSVCRW